MSIKEKREELGLTQVEASNLTGIPLRTYKRYELNEPKNIKYNYILEKLEAFGYVDENKGFLTLEKIKELSTPIFEKYDVLYCYLFGSYAKGTPREDSDIDLFVNLKLTGLKFYSFVEELRTVLKKKIDIITIEQLEKNLDLIQSILKDGIKIYEKS